MLNKKSRLFNNAEHFEKFANELADEEIIYEENRKVQLLNEERANGQLQDMDSVENDKRIEKVAAGIPEGTKCEESSHGETASETLSSAIENVRKAATGITADHVSPAPVISTGSRVPLLNEKRQIFSPSNISLPEIYKIAHTRDRAVPSVSRVLSATMSERSKAALAKWEKEKKAVLGLAGFKQLKADTFARGHTLHSMLETFMETRKLPKASAVPDSVSKRHLVSISQTVKQFHQPLLLESAIHHPELNYSGIVDCVAVVGDTVVLVDWKTSENVKNNAAALFDNPLQVAAYMGALNRDERYSNLGNINSGVVVVVYNSGFPAMVHMFNQEQMEKYWDKWCERLEMYNNMQS